MKKKILTFLLALASVVACAICMAACDDDVSYPAEYVGTYKVIYTRDITTVNGEQTITEIVPEGDGTPKDYYTLVLQDDGNYKMTLNEHGYIIPAGEGTWYVKNGELFLTSLTYSDYDYSDYVDNVEVNVSWEDGVLIILSKVTYNNVTEGFEMKFKKVVEETPAE